MSIAWATLIGEPGDPQTGPSPVCSLGPSETKMTEAQFSPRAAIRSSLFIFRRNDAADCAFSRLVRHFTNSGAALRRHPMPGRKNFKDPLVCPLCGEPLPAATSSCLDCGTNERPGLTVPVVTVVRDYVSDQVHVDRHIPPPATNVVPRKVRWFFSRP